MCAAPTKEHVLAGIREGLAIHVVSQRRAGLPEHQATKVLRVLPLEVARNVAHLLQIEVERRVRRLFVGGQPNEDFSLRVRRRLNHLNEVVKREVARAADEVARRAALGVVELHPDEIEERALDGVTQLRVRHHALRRGGGIVGAARVSLVQLAQPVGHLGVAVRAVVFNVKVEAVHNGIAERTRAAVRGALRSKRRPNELGKGLSRTTVADLLSLRLFPAKRQQNLSAQLLANGDVLLDLRASALQLSLDSGRVCVDRCATSAAEV